MLRFLSLKNDLSVDLDTDDTLIEELVDKNNTKI